MKYSHEEFVNKMAELDYSYQLLIARRRMLDEAIADKEAEINDFLRECQGRGN